MNFTFGGAVFFVPAAAESKTNGKFPRREWAGIRGSSHVLKGKIMESSAGKGNRLMNPGSESILRLLLQSSRGDRGDSCDARATIQGDDPVDTEPSRLLIVEPDAAITARLAGALRRRLTGGAVIRVAQSNASARDWKARESIHAALLDLRLPDGSGFDLIHSFSLAMGRPVALFLTAAGDPDSLGIARLLLEFPEVTFFEKPYDEERVAALIHDVLCPPPCDEANLFGLRLFDLVQAFSLARRSATLRVLFPDETMGTLVVRDGELIHARRGAVEGMEAVLALAACKSGEIRVLQAATDARRTIHMPTQQALLETFRLLDERQRLELEDLAPPDTSPGETPPAILQPDSDESKARKILEITATIDEVFQS